MDGLHNLVLICLALATDVSYQRPFLGRPVARLLEDPAGEVVQNQEMLHTHLLDSQLVKTHSSSPMLPFLQNGLGDSSKVVALQ
jgi:hypothetical protein